MPFGLHWAPTAFQRLMVKVLQPHWEYATAYIDDVVIYSCTWEDHIVTLLDVFQSLTEVGLTANMAKCAIGKEETKYFGSIMGKGRVKPVASSPGFIGCSGSCDQSLTEKNARGAFESITK